MAKGNEILAVLNLYNSVICKKPEGSAEFKDAFALLSLVGQSDAGSEVIAEVIALVLYDACSGKPSQVTELMAQTEELDNFIIACRKENASHDPKSPKAFICLSYLLVSAVKLNWTKAQKSYDGLHKLAQRVLGE